jgi:hypothetical protein
MNMQATIAAILAVLGTYGIPVVVALQASIVYAQAAGWKEPIWMGAAIVGIAAMTGVGNHPGVQAKLTAKRGKVQP